MSATASTRLLHKKDVRLLELLSHGLSDGMIGRELDVPAETVRANIRRVVNALGARNREHAVALRKGDTVVIVFEVAIEPRA